MKKKSKLAAIGATLVVPLVFALSVSSASAGDPIDGIDVDLQKNPGGSIVKQTHTDANGTVTFRDLAPGDYVIEINGKSLVATMDRLVPPASVKKSSGSSFSLGLGGMFGGGSSRSNEGKGPVGGERNSGRVGGIVVDPTDPNRVNNGGNSSGGVGLGVSIPIEGGGGGQAQGGGLYNNAPIISMTLTTTATPGTTSVPDARESSFSSETPYCRDTAGQGMRMGFTVTNGGGQPTGSYTATINWGDGSSTSQGTSARQPISDQGSGGVLTKSQPISDQGQTGVDTKK